MVLSGGIFFFKACPVTREIAFLEEREEEGKRTHYHEPLSVVGFVALADHDSFQLLLNITLSE